MSLSTVSPSVMDITQLILSFGVDFFAFIVVAALITLLGVFWGSDRFVPLIASIFVAIPLYEVFPFKDILGGNPYFLIGLYPVFVAIGLLAFSGFSSFLPSPGLGFLRTFVLSVLAAGLLLAIAIHVLPVEQVYTFSEPTKTLFASETAYFWWLLASLGGTFFLGRG